MRSTLVAALVSLALLACGGRGPLNRMIGAPTPLRALRAPHEAILVRTERGLARVYLDTGQTEIVHADRSAIAVGGDTSIAIMDGRYVVRRPGGEQAVAGLTAEYQPDVSPDGRWFAVVVAPSGPMFEGRDEIALVSMLDLSVRRFPVADRGVMTRWSVDSAELGYGHGHAARRILVATGEVVTGELPRSQSASWAEPAQPGAEVCAARGLRLELADASDQQQITAVPLAGDADPERLSAIQPRVVVAATDEPWSPHSGHQIPGALGEPFFTRGCEHMVFSLGDGIYVAEIATGRYAYLIAGWAPRLASP